MTLIIDASVAAKWFFAEEFSDKAETLQTLGRALIAPEITPVEVMNTAWKRYARSQITKAKASEVCLEAAHCFTSIEPISSLWTRAGIIMLDVSHPIYDCLYLALAERERVPLVTVDKRLIDAGKSLGTVDVVHLRDVR